MASVTNSSRPPPVFRLVAGLEPSTSQLVVDCHTTLSLWTSEAAS
jgi:hypothetical protein